MSASIVDKAAYEAKHGFPWQPLRCFHAKAAGRSASHARLALAEEGDDEGESASISLGTTVHALLQGAQDILIYPGTTRRGKDWEAFKAAHPGARIVLTKERDTAMHIADALAANDDAHRLLTARKVRREETLLFDYLGRQCRATPDLCADNRAWFAELKTTRNADPDKFAWDARKLGYHVQVAMQRLAIRANGGKPKRAIIIAAESAPPWPVTVFELDEETLLAGEKQLRLWVERILGCEASGFWPGYVQSVVPLRMAEAPLELVYAGDEATP
jgi:hypothetical protein